MSKQRARARAAREHEAGLRAAARAAEAERRERRAARTRGLRRVGDRLPRRSPVGRQTGTLARRRARRRTVLLLALLAVNVLVWVLRPDWPTRLGALVVTAIVAPMLVVLLSRRR